MKKKIPVDVNNCKVMSRSEVRSVDSRAIEEMGIAGVVLMENAGRGCAEIILERIGGNEGKRVCIFCGSGNNGGDGYVIARHLHNAGLTVRVVVCADRAKVKGDALANLEIIEKMGLDIRVIDVSGGGVGDAVGSADGFDMVVDAIFGTGLSGEVRGNYVDLIEGINGLKTAAIAVDIPSGLDCDEGVPLGAAVKADATVTFVAVKKGFALGDAGRFTGDVYVVSIGIEPQ